MLKHPEADTSLDADMLFTWLLLYVCCTIVLRCSGVMTVICQCCHEYKRAQDMRTHNVCTNCFHAASSYLRFLENNRQLRQQQKQLLQRQQQQQQQLSAADNAHGHTATAAA